MMALLTINNKAEEQKESWTRNRVIYLFEDEEEDDEDELFEIDLAVVDSLPPPRYCWDDDYDDDGRFSAATRSALLANCLLPIAQLSCAVPMAAKAGDALLLEPSTPERVSGFSSPVPVAVSGLQHDVEEYNEGEGKFLNGNCNSVEVSNYGVEQGVSSTQLVKAWLPLQKLFTEKCETQSSCSSSEADELDGVPAETYCVWRPKPVDDDQLFLGRCKKSNSTGSGSDPSKLWKFRDLLYRSNNDVFLTLSFKKRVDKNTCGKSKPI